ESQCAEDLGPAPEAQDSPGSAVWGTVGYRLRAHCRVRKGKEMQEPCRKWPLANTVCLSQRSGAMQSQASQVRRETEHWEGCAGAAMQESDPPGRYSIPHTAQAGIPEASIQCPAESRSQACLRKPAISPRAAQTAPRLSSQTRSRTSRSVS